jgi:ribosomal protein S18 acetylase RimI-like enzyme
LVDLLVTYMEMTTPPSASEVPPPLPGTSLRQECLGVTDYLELYRTIGQPLQWDQRLRTASAALEAFLGSPQTSLSVLRLHGSSVGLCEFEGIGRPDVELTHFGLVPAVQGRGLGPYLLDRALRTIWSKTPDRIWLHTDTNDHPKARDTYRKAGFQVFAQRVETFPD